MPSSPGVLSAVGNSLTTGLIDITGLTPTGGFGDRDTLTGLLAGTIGVTGLDGSGGHQWTLRSLGLGEVAYVSNGAHAGTPDTPSWADTSAGGAGAYNAALRNFAFNAATPTSVPEPTSLALLGLGLAGLGFSRRKKA